MSICRDSSGAISDLNIIFSYSTFFISVILTDSLL